jgi:hypothetical protein
MGKRMSRKRIVIAGVITSLVLSFMLPLGFSPWFRLIAFVIIRQEKAMKVRLLCKTNYQQLLDACREVMRDDELMKPGMTYPVRGAKRSPVLSRLAFGGHHTHFEKGQEPLLHNSATSVCSLKTSHPYFRRLAFLEPHSSTPYRYPEWEQQIGRLTAYGASLSTYIAAKPPRFNTKFGFFARQRRLYRIANENLRCYSGDIIPISRGARTSPAQS